MRFSILFLCCLVASPAAAQLPLRLTLDETLARARAGAPHLMAARFKVDEARGQLEGLPLLRENPEVEGGLGARDVDPGTLLEASVGVFQRFETGGQRGARADAARAALDEAEARAADGERRVLRQAARAFYQALAAEAGARLAQSAAGSAAELERVVERRQRAGELSQLEANLGRIAATRARAAADGREAERRIALGGLRRALGLDHETALELSGDLRPAPHRELGALLARLDERPDLRAIEAAAAAAVAEEGLGRAAGWPDVGIGASYERDDGNNVGMGNVVVWLPVFDRGQALRAEAAARAQRLRFEAASLRRAAEVELRAAYEAYELRQAAVIALESEAMPRLDDNRALAQRAYDAGDIGLTDLLAVQTATAAAREEYLERQLEAALAGVEVDAIAGAFP